MIKLSNRLLSLTKFIEKADNLIDIGCDHALLGIYLQKNKLVNKVISSDIVESAIKGANDNAKKYKESIDIRLGDGLEVISDKDNINTILISGMGYFKIKQILKKCKLKNINKIIIQTNSKDYDIRKYITSLDYYIKEESIIKEKHIYYTNIMFIKGFKKYSIKELLFGPYLLNNKDKVFYEYIDNKIKQTKILLNIIPKSYIILRLKKRIYIKMLKSVLISDNHN